LTLIGALVVTNVMLRRLTSRVVLLLLLLLAQMSLPISVFTAHLSVQTSVCCTWPKVVTKMAITLCHCSRCFKWIASIHGRI